MSQWTHVIGSFVTSESEEAIRNALGRPFLWSDAEKLEYGSKEYKEYFKASKKSAEAARNGTGGIPYGSEGTLKYYISIDKRDANTCGEGTYTTIHGDLRDFDNPTIIINWVKNIIRKISIRDFILSIDVESYGRLAVHYNGWTRLKITCIDYGSESWAKRFKKQYEQTIYVSTNYDWDTKTHSAEFFTSKTAFNTYIKKQRAKRKKEIAASKKK